MLPAAILVPAIHEFVKALCSTLQGDLVPKNTGRLTLNPFKHFEPIGFLFIMVFRFGWGRPLETSALYYRDRQRGVLVTYLVPVLVNLLLGIGSVILVSMLADDGIHTFSIAISWSLLETNLRILGIILLSHFALINISFAIFNLIPVYPLAANKLLLHFSRPDTIARLNHYEKNLQFLLMVGLILGLAEWVITPLALRIVAFAWGIVA